ncbi:MAG: hypothetical protein ABH823_01950 [bacterium]
MKKLLVFGALVMLLGLLMQGSSCEQLEASSPGATIAENTTTTSTTTTTTTSTTTTTIFGVSGTISNVTADGTLYIMAVKDSMEGTEETSAQVAITSGTDVSYEITLEVTGNYYVYAVDYDASSGPPAEDNQVGAYGWDGTDPLAAAGNVSLLNQALSAATSIEVTSMETASFTLHQIIAAETGTTVTCTIDYPVGAEAQNMYAILIATSDWAGAPTLSNDTVYAAESQVSATAGSTFAFEFTNVADDFYYCFIFENDASPITEYIGAYGYTGDGTVSNLLLWNDATPADIVTEMSSFEVSGENKALGTIALQVIE